MTTIARFITNGRAAATGMPIRQHAAPVVLRMAMPPMIRRIRAQPITAVTWNIHKRYFHATNAAYIISPSSSSATPSSISSKSPSHTMGHTVTPCSSSPPSPSSASAAADDQHVSAASIQGALTKLDQLHESDAKKQAAQALAPPPVRSKFGQLWHDYGMVGVGTYLGVYVSTLGFLYVVIQSGLVGGSTVLGLVHKLGMEDHMPAAFLNSPNASNFLVAWVATKLTEPVRLAVSIAITPKVARMIGRAPPKGVKPAEFEAAKQAAKAATKIAEAAAAKTNPKP